jgi:hypothetical protein
MLTVWKVTVHRGKSTFCAPEIANSLTLEKLREKGASTMRNRSDPSGSGDLLTWLVRRQFTCHVLGPMDNPHVIVLFYDWGRYIDVAHIRGEVRTEVARMRKGLEHSVYRPAHVVWHYWGGVIDALKALKRLPSPDDPIAPTRPYVPPRALVEVPVSGPREALSVAPEERGQVHVRMPNNAVVRRMRDGGLTGLGLFVPRARIA